MEGRKGRMERCFGRWVVEAILREGGGLREVTSG